ncbi:MAG: cobalamin B12-binding domain-containing protein [Planctomycetota bacterium]
MSNKLIRVLIAKPGLDGHDRGAKTIVHALREAGMEVIYTGLHRTVDEIIKVAREEDVDVIGLSILSGAHMPICELLVSRMKEEGISDKLVLAGGVIPQQDILELNTIGIKGVFPTRSSYDDIVKFIRENVNG